MKRTTILTAALVLLALLLTGCPEGVEEVEPDDDGAFPESEPLAPFTSQLDPDSWNLLNVNGVSMSKYETVYIIWYHVMTWSKDNANYTYANHGANGAGLNDVAYNGVTKLGYEGDPADTDGPGSDKPVTRISLRDAMVWCNAMSEAQKLSPVYRNSSGNILKDATKEVEKFVDAKQMEGRNGFRLFTVEEWLAASGREYMDYRDTGYRTGTTWTTGNHYSAANPGNSGIGKAYTTATGLGYMNGNVWEWCYNAADKSFALMGGDIWFWSAAQGFDWEPKTAKADDKGSTSAKLAPAHGFRVRKN